MEAHVHDSQPYDPPKIEARAELDMPLIGTTSVESCAVFP